LTLRLLTNAVGNTWLAIALCLAIAIPIGFMLSVLLVRSDVIGRRWALMAVASQLAIPLYVFAGGWSAGVGLQGWMRIAHWLGPTGVGWMQSWLGSLLAVSLIHAFAAIPWTTLILSLGLATNDRAEEEMALLDGGWLHLLRYLWLPRLRVWLVVACLWCVISLLTEMVVSNLYMFSTIAELVYLDFSRDSSSPTTYLAAAGLSILPIFIVGILLGRRLPDWNRVLVKPLHFIAPPIPLGQWRAIASLAVWIFVLFLVGLPVFNLLVKAGWQPQPLDNGLVTYGWSGQRFLQTLREALTLFQSEYYWSLMLAACSTSVAFAASGILFGMSVKSGGLVEPRKLVRYSIHGLMLILIATPGPLAGALVTGLINRPSPEWLGRAYTSTLVAPILAQQFRLLPIGWLVTCAIMASIPKRCWEVAQSDGLSFFQALRVVVWPQTWTYWIGMSLLLSCVSIGELSCTINVLPPGVTTTSMRLFEILHFGMRHQDSAMCIILILMGWLTAYVMRWSLESRIAKGR
jgi:iron(III) transport system permease protein